jgi:hypothetical protein
MQLSTAAPCYRAPPPAPPPKEAFKVCRTKWKQLQLPKPFCKDGTPLLGVPPNLICESGLSPVCASGYLYNPPTGRCVPSAPDAPMHQESAS